MYLKHSLSIHCAQWLSCPTLCDSELYPSRLLCPWDSPGKNNWSGWPFPPPGDLPDPGIEPTSLMSPALAGRFFTTRPPGQLLLHIRHLIFVSSCQEP